MTRRARSTAFALFGAAALAGGLALAGPAHAGDPVPYTDPSANGYVGLCDASGHQVTSGSIDDDPFVVRATGSSPPPEDYRVDGEQATLYAFVPRKGIPPSQWSSEPLTGPTYFNDWHVPTAIGTTYDPTLGQVLRDLPPQWDGYYQLRLYYSGPDRPIPGGGYAATDIRITGSTWTVARGGPVDCTGGKATPREALIPGLLVSDSFVPTYINGRPNPKASWPGGVVPTYSAAPFDDDPTPTPTSTAAPSARSSGDASAGPAGGAVGASGTSSNGPAKGADDALRPAAATHERAGGGISTGLVIVVAIVLVAIAGAVGWVIRARVSSASG